MSPSTNSSSIASADREPVLTALRTVRDPELGADIVSLGLIYELRVDLPTVLIRMTMTTPFCPFEEQFRQDIHRVVSAVPGITTVNVDFVFEPVWTPARIDPAVRAQLGLRTG